MLKEALNARRLYLLQRNTVNRVIQAVPIPTLACPGPKSGWNLAKSTHMQNFALQTSVVWPSFAGPHVVLRGAGHQSVARTECTRTPVNAMRRRGSEAVLPIEDGVGSNDPPLRTSSMLHCSIPSSRGASG